MTYVIYDVFFIATQMIDNKKMLSSRQGRAREGGISTTMFSVAYSYKYNGYYTLLLPGFRIPIPIL